MRNDPANRAGLHAISKAIGHHLGMKSQISDKLAKGLTEEDRVDLVGRIMRQVRINIDMNKVRFRAATKPKAKSEPKPAPAPAKPDKFGLPL